MGGDHLTIVVSRANIGGAEGSAGRVWRRGLRVQAAIISSGGAGRRGHAGVIVVYADKVDKEQGLLAPGDRIIIVTFADKRFRKVADDLQEREGGRYLR